MGQLNKCLKLAKDSDCIGIDAAEPLDGDTPASFVVILGADCRRTTKPNGMTAPSGRTVFEIIRDMWRFSRGSDIRMQLTATINACRPRLRRSEDRSGEFIPAKCTAQLPCCSTDLSNIVKVVVTPMSK
jgi:hypothetical protein